MALLLTDLGARVVLASDGLAGLEAVSRLLPDVVLSDLRMLRLDGFGFVWRIRQYPRSAGLSVIPMSELVGGSGPRGAKPGSMPPWRSPATRPSCAR